MGQASWEQPPGGLRERTRDAVRADVRRTALALFGERGFDATTTDDIAKAAGISSRSFFRLFTTKEDVLVGESAAYGTLIADRLAARPHDEPIWTALRAALDPLIRATIDEPRRGFDTMQIIYSVPALRAQHVEKHFAWAEQLTPVITQRLKDAADEHHDNDTARRARTIAHAALSCLDVAYLQWIENGISEALQPLLDASLTHLQHSFDH